MDWVSQEATLPKEKTRPAPRRLQGEGQWGSVEAVIPELSWTIYYLAVSP